MTTFLAYLEPKSTTQTPATNSGEARDFEVGGFCNAWEYKDRGSGGQKSPRGVQGQSPGRGSGGS